MAKHRCESLQRQATQAIQSSQFGAMPPIQRKVVELQRQLSEATISAENWLEELDRANERADGLSAQLTSCRSELTNCRSELTDCRSELTNCRSELTNCRSELTNCQSELTNCRSELTNCRSELTNCESELTNCQAEARKFRQAIQSLSEKLRALRSFRRRTCTLAMLGATMFLCYASAAYISGMGVSLPGSYPSREVATSQSIPLAIRHNKHDSYERQVVDELITCNESLYLVSDSSPCFHQMEAAAKALVALVVQVPSGETAVPTDRGWTWSAPLLLLVLLLGGSVVWLFCDQPFAPTGQGMESAPDGSVINDSAPLPSGATAIDEDWVHDVWTWGDAQ